jgi:hypothetical protein
MSSDALKLPAVVGESENWIDIDVGINSWQCLADDRYILEEDFKVSGDIWRVHLSDADPFPSAPHAHCIGGAKRFIGCKLHLGNRQLFDSKNKPMDRRLEESQFARLIELVKPKFPNIIWPLKG